LKLSIAPPEFCLEKVKEQDPTPDLTPTKTPLHDRYIVTQDAGWILGSSFNSLASNHSLIAELTPADAKRLEEQFSDWWANDVIGKDGQPCTKESF